jgi:hypothetical protein
MAPAAVVLPGADRQLLEGGGGVGVGEVIRRAPAEAFRLAWVRCRSELYLPAVLSFLVSVRLLAISFFLPFSQTIPYKFDIRVSVYIRPVCINALGLRESLSRLGLHNNALGLRESSSRLGLHKCPWFA